MKSIQIIVSPQGQTTIQTKGYTGSSCREATRLLERALGVVQADTPTAEMYHSATIQQAAQQKAGR